MASRNLTALTFAFNRDMAVITGKVVGNGASNPTAAGTKGLGIASVARTSSGKYTITLSDKWAGLFAANFTVIDSTALRYYSVSVSAETVATTKTIVLEVFGAATGVAAARSDLATTDTLLIELLLSNSVQTPRSF